MSDTLIITFMARDRPGIVDQLSQIVTAHDGNWMESRMAHLAETFAGVARVSVASDKAVGLKAAVQALESAGFQVMVHDADSAGPTPTGALLSFEIFGPDHPGIVHELTHKIATLGASVEEMETRIESAPVGGGTIFRADTTVRLPDGLSEDDFKNALEESAETLFVDIVIED